MQKLESDSTSIRVATPTAVNIAGEIAPKERAGPRLQSLFTLVFALAALIIWLLPKDPMIAWKINSFLHPESAPAQSIRDYNEDMKKDPPEGSFPISKLYVKTLFSSLKHTRTGYLVVYVGDCAGCISMNLREWQRQADKNHVTMLLLTSASQNKANKFTKQLSLEIPIISDMKSKAIEPLNAVWPGRAYFFSPHWRLLWLQREHNPGYDPFKELFFLQKLHSATIGE